MTQSPIRPPYGDVYFAETPHIDRVQNMLYEEQKQRDFLRQKQAQVLDDEFRKNVSNVRDTDIQEFTKKYQTWKQARQDLLRIKPKNQDEQIKKQMDAQQKLADLYEFGNKSKQAKDEEDELAKDLMKNPNNYDDNAFGLLSARRKLPLGQLSTFKDQSGKVYDLSNADTFRYKGTNTDFGKILTDAVGTSRQVFSNEEAMPGGLQFKITPYNYANSPAQVKDKILGSFALHQAGRDAEHQWDTISEQEKADTIAAFKSIPADQWKKMGIDSPQDLMPKNQDSKAEKLASHMAMQYAISNQPKEGTPVFRRNEDAVDKRNFEQQKELQRMRDASAAARLKKQDEYIRGRISYRKAQGKKEQDGVLEGYINRAFDEGKDTKQVVGLKGQWVPARNIVVPKEITDKYTIDKGKDWAQRPVKFMITEDKKYVIPVYAGDKKNQRTTVKEENHIPIETFRNDLGKIWLTKKDAAAEMDELDFGEDEDGEDVPVSIPSAPARKQTATKSKDPLGLF